MARTLAVEQFLAALPPGDSTILVAVGGFGVTDCDRIGLVVLENPLRVVEDAYLAKTELDALVRQIAAVRPARKGGWNTMHATGWSFIWSDAPFEVYDDNGRLARVEDDRVQTREQTIHRSLIAAVEPFVGGDWVERGVRVRLHDGSLHTIASEEDRWPSLDFTYDGLNLLADTFWCFDLGRALSNSLGAPLVDCT